MAGVFDLELSGCRDHEEDIDSEDDEFEVSLRFAAASNQDKDHHRVCSPMYLMFSIT